MGTKWLIDFNARKTFLFDGSKTTGAIDVKIDGSVIEEKSPFKVLELTFFSKLDWGPKIISVAKTIFKKIGALTHSMKDFLLRLLYISINLPHKFACNTTVMSRLVLLAATWNC